MGQSKPVIKIDLQGKSLPEQIAVLNAILRARIELEEKGFKLTVKRKQHSAPTK